MKEVFKTSPEELNAYLRKPLDWKIEDTKNSLETVIESSNPVVSCSWGKDSTLVLYLARQIKPNIAVVFNNTLAEYPETYAFRDRMIKEWSLNYFETKPDKTFWQIACERKEYPYPRLQGHREPACCLRLKRKPMRLWMKQHPEINANITGLTCAESQHRRLAVLRRCRTYLSLGKYYGKPIIVSHPLAYWTEKNVWEYTHQQNVPINRAYRKMPRVGCMPCTAHKYWREQLARNNPKMLHKILKDMAEWNDPRAYQTIEMSIKEDAEAHARREKHKITEVKRT